MRHVRFRDPAGSVRKGVWTDDGIEFADQTYDPSEVEVLAPCEPSKIVCIGRNYQKHIDEKDSETPDRPMFFLKPPNAISTHGATVTLPNDNYFEHEAEFGVVIGEQCRNVSEEDALDVVAGYTCADDISNRTDQRQEQNWIRGKAFDNACPLGPVVADPEHVPDDASIRLRVNGEVRQDSSIEHFIFSIPELIAELTSYMTLEPGDVIITGTPEGVGPLEDGDHVEIEIEGVGTLEHDVAKPE